MLQCFSQVWSRESLHLVVFLFSLITVAEGTELFLDRFVLQRCKWPGYHLIPRHLSSPLCKLGDKSERKRCQNSDAKCNCCHYVTLTRAVVKAFFFPCCAAATSVQHFLSIELFDARVLKTNAGCRPVLSHFLKPKTKILTVQCLKLGMINDFLLIKGLYTVSKYININMY